ncbi:Ppx/GppA phosphatase family protein [Devosia sp. J2-20]|uniref:Ppx/GppA family phosphatase n=1 Tax=Devosia litorisediminis TaxID=2829817 RepID=A0A942E6A4_9HYPH|nr:MULTISPECIES: Ppx/GppA phosphatase family protein [Devosia]MBS3848958.1 Ppx/GppA family phosphatase [Devosia litorisediminis]MCZ4346056.1 Ppx/GppA phosphatase family protein [Devosia neptuniae]WDQ97965.1 Ppx/GppA phosphatase family protein [Devosia sp. J2-20]
MTDSDRSAAVPPSLDEPALRAPSGPDQVGKTVAKGPAVHTDKRTAPATNPTRKHRGPLYAALDLGTNNCRLLIARPHDHGFRVLDGFTRIVRLGEGVSVTGRLGEAAMDRTIDALRQCRNKLREHQPARMRLIATEACRAAENGPAFLERVKEEVGLELEIVDRRTEAELAVTGCADLIDADTAGALIFDIGGGSSELAWLDFRGGRPKSQGRMPASIRSWQSLPVGVVSIAEKFGGVNVTPEVFEAMVNHVSDHLRQFRGREKLRQMIASHPVHLIGTSGTVTTLAGLHLGLERYERQKVDGLWMHRDQVDETMNVLIGMPFERRVAHPCIGRDRADLVLPGCAIFEAIRREWPTERVRVADRGLREGILISLMDADRTRSRASRYPRRNNNGG